MKKQMGKQDRKTKRGFGCLCSVLLCTAVLAACGSSSQSGQDNTSPQTARESSAPSAQLETDGTVPSAENSSQTDGNITESENGTAPADTVADNAVQNGGQAADNNQAVIELSGSIESVSDGSFIVNQIFNETQEDGSLIAYSSTEDKTLLNIAYNAQTAFTICTSADGGKTSDNTAGTAADLEVGNSTLMKGYWEGDIFQAQEIIIYHFG